MKKLLLQLIHMAIGGIFLLLYSRCFAVDKYPWYFYPNQVEQCWDITQGKTRQGNNVIVDIIDSKISFISMLKDKEYFSKSYLKSNHRKPNDAEILHGTAMAGLIAGERANLPCKYDVKECTVLRDDEGKVAIAGIAPGVKIISREWLPEGDLETAMLEALNLEEKVIPNNSEGKPILKRDREIKLILLNISGGKKVRMSGDEIRSSWLDTIKRKIKENEYFLIMAAVGNDGDQITGENGFIPAILPPPKKDRDALIRVGATSKYSNGELPRIHAQSNYGSRFVDIMAPGELIPVLTPESKIQIGGGTSEATALVSGTIALLISCHPKATADRIKQVLLKNSDEYSQLGDKVTKGRVLNIYKAVHSYCIKDPFIDSEDKNEVDHTDL